MSDKEDYIKGRGAQVNIHNHFSKHAYVQEHWEGIDEDPEYQPDTQYLEEHPKKILNAVNSPDIGMVYSLNPYQGCEHGCIYCYARPTHEYWGFSAGLDFEKKIIVKSNAAELLEKEITAKNYQPRPLMFAGNTDIYQPVERKTQITRRILEVMLKYKHPVGLITKNSLILRDLDILEELAKYDLTHVSLSITSLREETRRLLEPRTASVKSKLNVIKTLTEKGVPVNVMMAPLIPAINTEEIPELLKTVADHGAVSAHYTIVRLNDTVAPLFEDWIRKNYPDRADKVLKLIADCHGGSVSDKRFGTRMRGEGNIAEMITELFRIHKAKYFKDRVYKPYDFSHFKGYQDPQGKLF